MSFSISAAMIAAVIATATSTTKAPIERLLAGYTIEKTAIAAIRDTRTGCYFIRTID